MAVFVASVSGLHVAPSVNVNLNVLGGMFLAAVALVCIVVYKIKMSRIGYKHLPNADF